MVLTAYYYSTAGWAHGDASSAQLGESNVRKVADVTVLLSSYPLFGWVEGFNLSYELLIQKASLGASHRLRSAGDFYIYDRERQASVLPVSINTAWQLMCLVQKPSNICTSICTCKWLCITVRQVVNYMYIKFIEKLVIFNYNCRFTVYMVRIF